MNWGAVNFEWVINTFGSGVLTGLVDWVRVLRLGCWAFVHFGLWKVFGLFGFGSGCSIISFGLVNLTRTKIENLNQKD